MSNNYNTQLRSKSNVLNEVATNHQILQQYPQYNQQNPQYNQQNPQYNQQNNNMQNENEELELSDDIPNDFPQENNSTDNNPKEDNIPPNKSQSQKNKNDRNPPFENSRVPSKQRSLTKTLQNPHQPTKSDDSILPPTIIIPKKSNTTIEFIIIPLVIMAITFILFYPKTSDYLNKYLPPLKEIKGYLIRIIILGIMYVALRFGADQMNK